MALTRSRSGPNMLSHNSDNSIKAHSRIRKEPVCSVNLTLGRQKSTPKLGQSLIKRQYLKKFEPPKGNLMEYWNIKLEKRESYQSFPEITTGVVGKCHNLFESLKNVTTKEERLKLQERLQNFQDENESLRRTITNQEKAISASKNDIDNKDTIITLLEEKIVQHEIRASAIPSSNPQGGIATGQRIVLAKLKNAGTAYEFMEKQSKQNGKNYNKHVIELLEELKDKDTTLAMLKTDLDGLHAKLDLITTQKAALIDENVYLKDERKLIIYELKENESKGSLIRKLLREFSFCRMELKNLVNIIETHLDGDDPNLSALLGMQSLNLLSCDIPSKGHYFAADLEREVENIQSISSELSDLRNKLADNYSEHLGNNLKCQMQ